MKTLAVIIPVYNEEQIIETVIREWTNELDNLNLNYNIVLYDGESKDNTVKIIDDFSKVNPNVLLKKIGHIGHGPTVISAYKEISKEYEWIFQVDSDNEISAVEFKQFWENHDNYDLIIGIRQNRNQTLLRKVITKTSRFMLNLLFRNVPSDTNCPYRLMRSVVFKNFYDSLPCNVNVPNILISAYTGSHNINFLELPVKYTFRQTGAVSLNKMNLIKVSIKSFFEILNLYKLINEVNI